MVYSGDKECRDREDLSNVSRVTVRPRERARCGVCTLGLAMVRRRINCSPATLSGTGGPLRATGVACGRGVWAGVGGRWRWEGQAWVPLSRGVWRAVWKPQEKLLAMADGDSLSDVLALAVETLRVRVFGVSWNAGSTPFLDARAECGGGGRQRRRLNECRRAVAAGKECEVVETRSVEMG
jgi:hypothetical protein